MLQSDFVEYGSPKGSEGARKNLLINCNDQHSKFLISEFLEDELDFCTFEKTGKKQTQQPSYHCGTCNIRVCVPCGLHCHRGHKLSPSWSMVFYCGCDGDAEDEDSCCLLKNQNQKKKANKNCCGSNEEETPLHVVLEDEPDSDIDDLNHDKIVIKLDGGNAEVDLMKKKKNCACHTSTAPRPVAAIQTQNDDNDQIVISFDESDSDGDASLDEETEKLRLKKPPAKGMKSRKIMQREVSHEDLISAGDPKNGVGSTIVEALENLTIVPFDQIYLPLHAFHDLDDVFLQGHVHGAGVGGAATGVDAVGADVADPLEEVLLEEVDPNSEYVDYTAHRFLDYILMRGREIEEIVIIGHPNLNRDGSSFVGSSHGGTYNPYDYDEDSEDSFPALFYTLLFLLISPFMILLIPFYGWFYIIWLNSDSCEKKFLRFFCWTCLLTRILLMVALTPMVLSLVYYFFQRYGFNGGITTMFQKLNDDIEEPPSCTKWTLSLCT